MDSLTSLYQAASPSECFWTLNMYLIFLAMWVACSKMSVHTSLNQLWYYCKHVIEIPPSPLTKQSKLLHLHNNKRLVVTEIQTIWQLVSAFTIYSWQYFQYSLTHQITWAELQNTLFNLSAQCSTCR